MSIQNNFAKGSIPRHILNLAGPMIVAQFINVLYNIVDRIYIGRIPEVATQAMGGLGICLPLITIIMAFANWFGMGGAPLCSMARGRGDIVEAEEIMGNAFLLLIIFSGILMAVILTFERPILLALGASEDTFLYAEGYMKIYAIGTPFVLIGLGMNSFINSQGFAKTGMMTVLIGAICNIALDPIFIFGFSMGVRGAALATVISQMLSAVWTLYFLTGKRTILKLTRKRMRLQKQYVTQIFSLGAAGFMVEITNSVVTAVCNTTLSVYGGDLYIAIMTIINSIRTIVSLPGQGITHASQPVLSYNYGAREYKRVLEGIRFITLTSLFVLFLMWALINIFPAQIFAIFTSNREILLHGIKACRLYFFGFFMMGFQFCGQSIAVSLGKAKQAIFFSIFRKIIIVAPLTVILPKFIGIDGVFIAEAVSNFVGGLACYITMWFTIRKNLKRQINI